MALSLLVLFALATGCATRLPPNDTFSTAAWSNVEAVPVGSRVEVRYVTGDPPLRYNFEGTLRSASPDILEVVTRNGLQRLLPGRVLRVAVGGRDSWVMELGSAGVLLGGFLGACVTAINEGDDGNAALIGALIGGSLGVAAASRRGTARPTVVYERRGSL